MSINPVLQTTASAFYFIEPPAAGEVAGGASPASAPVSSVSSYTLGLLQSAYAALARDQLFLSEKESLRLPQWLTQDPSLSLQQGASSWDVSAIPMSATTRNLFEKALNFFNLEQQVSAKTMIAFMHSLDQSGQGITHEQLLQKRAEHYREAERRILQTLQNDKSLFALLASLDGNAGSLSVSDVWIASAGQGAVVLSARVIGRVKESLANAGTLETDRNFETMWGLLKRNTAASGDVIPLDAFRNFRPSNAAFSPGERAWIHALQGSNIQAALAPLMGPERNELTREAAAAFWAISTLHRELAPTASMTVTHQRELNAVANATPTAPIRVEQAAMGLSGKNQAVSAAFLNEDVLSALLDIVKRHDDSLIISHIPAVIPQSEEEKEALAVLKNPAILRMLADNDGDLTDITTEDIRIQRRNHLICFQATHHTMAYLL